MHSLKALICCSVLVLGATSPLQAQVGAGTLHQSISPFQNPGVTQVALPGNPSVTTNEVISWSESDPIGGGRSLFHSPGLGLLFGDISGDSRPFDWPDIDAMEVKTTPLQQNQPSPYDLRVSFSSPVVGPGGIPNITTGDVIRLTGIGSYTTEVTRSQLQAALGNNTALDVDGYAEVADGAILVSFRNNGAGTNIINPVNGTVGSSVPFSAADVFIIRPPFGLTPALFAYRQSELAVVVNFYYGNFPYADNGGIAIQTLFPTGVTAPALPNPNDPLNTYQGGNRPYLLWTVQGDDNVFCWNNLLNPRTTLDNFYAGIGTNQGNSLLGYSTNVASSRVFVDALSVTADDLGAHSRATLDSSSLLPVGGSSLTLTVRSAQPAGVQYQLVLSTTLGSGLGSIVGGSGFLYLVNNLADPLLTASLTSLAPLLLTAPTDALGTAASLPITIPVSITNTIFYAQGVALTPPFSLTAPLAVVVP